jgi:hypothetical protein
VRRSTLYGDLLKGIYTVKGEANSLFLGDLAQPLVRTVCNGETSGVLALIPANVAASLRQQIEWHEQAIQEERDMWLDNIYGEEYEDYLSASSVEYIAALEVDLAKLREELAAL